jgi:hypothetical protein
MQRKTRSPLFAASAHESRSRHGKLGEQLLEAPARRSMSGSRRSRPMFLGVFRLQHFPGWPHERVAVALGMWSTRRGIKVTFEGRSVNDSPVIWVCFGPA